MGQFEISKNKLPYEPVFHAFIVIFGLNLKSIATQQYKKNPTLWQIFYNYRIYFKSLLTISKKCWCVADLLNIFGSFLPYLKYMYFHPLFCLFPHCFIASPKWTFCPYFTLFMIIDYEGSIKHVACSPQFIRNPI